MSLSKRGTAHHTRRTARTTLAVLMISAFTAELLATAALQLSWPHSLLTEGLLDAALLCILLFPAFFFIVLRPLERDFAERERSEQALQESEERLRASLDTLTESEGRYRLLADHMTDTVWLFDMQLKTTYVSPSVERTSGYSLEEVVATPLDQHLTPASLQLAMEAYSNELPRIMEDRHYALHRTLELELRGKDGTTRWSESTFTVIRDDVGQPVSILAEGRDITERKRTEAALKDSEQRLRTIIETEPECVTLIDADCTLLEMNAAGLAMVEADSLDQIKGLSVLDLIAPEYHAHYRDGVAAVLRGETVTQTFELIGLRGTRRWMEQSAVLLKGGDAASVQILAITRDISERKRAVEALQENERLLLAAQKIGGVGSYVLDVASGRWTSSGVLDEIFGIDDAFVRSIEGWLEVVHPGSRAAMATYFQEDVLAKRGQFDREYQVVRKNDGEELWVHGLGELEFNSLGEPLRMVGTVQDITTRKRAEEAQTRARSVESRLAALVESSEDAVVSIDGRGELTSWNRAAERLFGYSASEAIGRHWTFLVPEDLTAEREQLAGMMGEGQVAHIETERKTRDGRRIPVAITFFPLRGIEGEAGGAVEIGAIVRDLTNERRVEAEKARLEEQFQQAQRLESLGLLARGVAHDFNNQLSSILGYTQLALNGLPADTEVRGDLEIVEASAAASADLVRQLMIYSGNYQPAKAMIDLSGIVSDMTRLLAAKLGRMVTLETSLEPDIPPIEADAVQLRQVVMNLVSNAGEAMEGRPGRVVVATGTLCAGPDELARAYGQTSLQPGPCVFLNVVDNGKGIDAETMSHLFEPFYTTKEGGHGLGMASVFGIVRSHGGAISVASEPGNGTTFHLLFPLA